MQKFYDCPVCKGEQGLDPNCIFCQGLGGENKKDTSGRKNGRQKNKLPKSQINTAEEKFDPTTDLFAPNLF